MGKIIKAVEGPVLGLFTGGGKGALQGLTNLATAYFGGPVAAALSIGSTLLKPSSKTPGVSPSQIDRLNASLVPSAPRKMVLGRTAMATDIRYVEPSGTNQEYIDYIIAVASHTVHSIEEIWLEDRQAWNSTGGVQTGYTGFLTVDVRLAGTAANAITINGGSKWGSAQRLTGCAYVHLRIKRSGQTSPFSGGLTSRMTIIGSGMPVYDPRYDSTVAGGSGTQRVDDQSTWSFTGGSGLAAGDNVALQTLAYLLGWRINGKLAVGRGIPPARLNLEAFADAARLCDETVAYSGGNQPRYRGAGIISEADEPSQALETMATSCNGRLREEGGQLSLVVMHNDLALAAMDSGLNDNDITGGFVWNPDPSLEQTYNVVRGRFTDPSAASLYQLVDYPEIRIDSLDGIDRILPLDLPWVEDAAQAQRMAKQVLQRKQFQRTFSAPFGPRVGAYTVGQLVPLTFAPLGFDRKLFRVSEAPVPFSGQRNFVLVEEDAALYQWDADDRAPVVASTPITYDPSNDPNQVQAYAPLTIGVTPSTVFVACESDGTPKSGALPQSAQIMLHKGAADVHADAATSYSVSSSSGGSWSVGSTGGVTLSSITADTASVVIAATYMTQTVYQSVTATKVRDGEPGTNTSSQNFGVSSEGYTAAPMSISLANGQTLTSSFSLHITNTDTTGSTVSLYIEAKNGTGGAWSIALGSNSGSVGAGGSTAFSGSGSYTNTSGGAQTIYARANLVRSGGACTYDGSVGLSAS